MLATYEGEIGYLSVDLCGRYPGLATFRFGVSFSFLRLYDTHTEL